MYLGINIPKSFAEKSGLKMTPIIIAIYPIILLKIYSRQATAKFFLVTLLSEIKYLINKNIHTADNKTAIKNINPTNTLYLNIMTVS